MATIQTAIRLQDQMTAPLRNMLKTMDIVINSFERMQKVSGSAIDISGIQQARQSLSQVAESINKTEENIRRATNEQRNFNHEISNGSGAASGLAGKISGIVTAYAGFRGLKAVLSMSDTVATTNARLDMMNDELQTTESLQNKIFASAQRARTDYTTTADVVSKLGIRAKDAFTSNDEIIAFVEQLNKQFIIAGASQEEINSASLQLTQALGSGVLRGEELNAVFEAAPNIIQSIADYMGKPIGQIREMASQGQISANVVKNAMFDAAKETNAAFDRMPKTFAQLWVSALNKVKKAFEPLLKKFNDLANSPKFETFIDNIVISLAYLANIALYLFDTIVSIYNFFADNWSLIGPIVWTIVGAFIAYKVAVLAAKGAMALYNIGQGLFAIATGTATTAQRGLNTAMYACPLTWIVLMIVAVILAVYGAVAAFNKFAGTSVSATGIIAGAIMFALYSIYNIFGAVWNFIIDLVVIVWNLIAAFANFFGNAFDDPVEAIARLFVNLVNFVLGLLKSLASVIDFLFGSHLADGVQGWMDGLNSKVDEIFGEEVEHMFKINAEDYKLNRADPFEGWDKGYEWGKGLEDSISNFNPEDLFSGLGGLEKSLNDLSEANVPADIGNTAENTQAIKDSLDISSEDLKYLRDLAEQEVINRFTTAELKIDFTANNNVNSDTDIDGIVDALANRVQEALVSTAEGVH